MLDNVLISFGFGIIDNSLEALFLDHFIFEPLVIIRVVPKAVNIEPRTTIAKYEDPIQSMSSD
jgi:hypothetical protein